MGKEGGICELCVLLLLVEVGGIGFEIAKACLADGYEVLGIARDGSRLNQAAKKLDG